MYRCVPPSAARTLPAHPQDSDPPAATSVAAPAAAAANCTMGLSLRLPGWRYSAWVGYDLNPHPLGKYETGGRAALPIWLAYMTRALEGRSQPEFAPPPSLDLVQRRIDRKTGRLASSGKNSMTLWFKRGTEPEDSEPEKGAADANTFLQVP